MFLILGWMLALRVNLSEIESFVFVINCLQFSDKFHVVFFVQNPGFHRLILKFADGENDLRHECEVVSYKKIESFVD